MMARRRAVLTEADLQALLARVSKEGPLMGPVRRGRKSVAFEWVEEPGAIELRYVRTLLPPKRAMFPEREAFLRFRRAPDAQAEGVVSEEPYVLFGVHPCDLAAINQLDWAMGRRHDIVDPNYVARRGAATIVGMECLPDEYCFCPSVGTCDTREGADLFLTPVGSGYLAEALTEKGEALVAGGPAGRAPSTEEEAEAAAWPEKKRQMTTCRIDAEMAQLPDILDSRYESEVWEETSRRCYSCGTCTNVCPTCFCYDVVDTMDLDLTSGTRERVYDSCQHLEFALVAGGHNFRGERGDRVRHRWFRKFVHLLREHGKPFCVGCGRCTQGCTAGISLTAVLNAVIGEAKGMVV
jgi:sulfhydrogenase subunit beta (sulfur reductase)